MKMDQLPGNSHRAREEEARNTKPEVKKVVEGKVVVRRKSIWRRMTENLFVNRFDVVVDHVIGEVIVPALKLTVVDAGTSLLDRMILGEGGRVMGARASSLLGQSIGTYGQQTNYNKIGNQIPGAQQHVPNITSQGRTSHNISEVVLPTRLDAEAVIDNMFRRCSDYNSVTVADFYELCGITPNWTDDKFGWTDIRGAGVLRVGGGFIVNLPRPIPLD